MRVSVSIFILFTSLGCARPDPHSAPKQTNGAPIDLSDIVRRTRLRFRPDSDGFAASGRAWHVRISGDEIRLAIGPKSSVTFRSGEPARAPPSVDEQGGLRIARSEVVETIRNREEGIEQSWEFSARPKAPVRFSIEVRGQTYAGASDHGLHFVDAATGVGTRYGTAWWIDAAGAKTRIDPIWKNDRIEIVVSEELVSKSEYPVLLDPIITPEMGMDQPLRRSMLGLEGAGRVASGAGVHLIAWSEEAVNSTIPNQIHAVRIRASDGVLLDQQPIAVSAGSDPDVIFDGSVNFFVVANNRVARASNGALTTQIGGKRVRASDGVVLDANDLPISEEDRGGRLRVAFGDSRFLVAWTQEGVSGEADIYVRMLGANGARIGGADTLIAGSPAAERDAFVCFADGHFLVGYRIEVSPNNYAIVARRVRASDGAVLDAGGLSVASAPPSRSSVTCNGNTTHHLIAWTESSGAGINMRRIQAATGALDPTPTPLAISTGVPRLAFDGTNFVAIWADALDPAGNGDVYGRRIAPDLTLIDGPLASRGIPIATSSASEYPEGIAEVGGTYFALWSIYESRFDLVGRRVQASDGAILDSAPRRITFNANPQTQPSVAYGGGNFFVAWYDRRYSFARFYDIDLVGVRVRASDGMVLDPSGMTILEDLASTYAPPGIASDGNSFLVAAHRRPIMLLDAEIVARRVRSSDGAVLDAVDIVVEPTSLIEPMHLKTAVAFGGNAYVVVFPRFVDDPQLGRVSRQIVSRRIDPTTGALLGSATSIANDPTRVVSEPAIACEAQTCMTTWLAGDRLTDLEDLLAARVHAFNGSLVDTTPFVLVPPIAGNRSFYSADIAFDGTDYLAIWTQSGGIRGRRVRTNGSILGAPELNISPAPADTNARLAFDGTHFVVVWAAHVTTPDWYLSAARVLSPGLVVDTTPLDLGVSVSDYAQPAVASNGAGLSLATYARFDETPGVFTDRLFARLIANLPNGLPCIIDDECASSYCIEGLCCDSLCGAGDPNDCIACSVAAGAPQDGTCGFLPSTAICRPSMKACDPIETCTGMTAECPPDVISGLCPSDAGEPDASEPASDAGDLDSAEATDATATPDASEAPDVAEARDVAEAPDAFESVDAMDDFPSLDDSTIEDNDDDDGGCSCAASRSESKGRWWWMIGFIGLLLRRKSLLLALLLSACSGPKTSETRGAEGGPCYAEGSCSAGLVCIEAICRPESEGDPDAEIDGGLEPPDAASSDAEPTDAESADAEGEDAAPSDASARDAEAEDALAGDGCTPPCELELRIDSLSTSNCTVVNDYGPSGISLVGIGLNATHLLSATIFSLRSFLRPNLTGVQELVNGDYFDEIFSDLSTSTVYVLTDSGLPIGGYWATADGMFELTATGTTSFIPLSMPIELHETSYRFSGRGFVIVLTHEADVALANGYRIELPSGIVTDLGPLPAFGTHNTCPGNGGIAESFGGNIYLVAPDTTLARVGVIKRHRIPDGATSIVADVGDLGNLCSFTIDPVLGRWYFDWWGPSQLGGTDRSVAHCDASFQPGSDGIAVFPGVRKAPLSVETAYGYGLFTSSQVGATALANSFVAPAQNTRPISLGAWIVNEATVERPNISLQIWGSTANGAPDVNQILAMTPAFTAANATVTTYFDVPVIAGAAPLMPGSRYWFVATTLGLPQPPDWGIDRFARHNQNSDGLIDDGVLMYSFDPVGIAFTPNSGDAWAELAFTVTLGP